MRGTLYNGCIYVGTDRTTFLLILSSQPDWDRSESSSHVPRKSADECLDDSFCYRPIWPEHNSWTCYHNDSLKLPQHVRDSDPCWLPIYGQSKTVFGHSSDLMHFPHTYEGKKSVPSYAIKAKSKYCIIYYGIGWRQIPLTLTLTASIPVCLIIEEILLIFLANPTCARRPGIRCPETQQ